MKWKNAEDVEFEVVEILSNLEGRSSKVKASSDRVFFYRVLCSDGKIRKSKTYVPQSGYYTRGTFFSEPVD